MLVRLVRILKLPEIVVVDDSYIADALVNGLDLCPIVALQSARQVIEEALQDGTLKLAL